MQTLVQKWISFNSPGLGPGRVRSSVLQLWTWNRITISAISGFEQELLQFLLQVIAVAAVGGCQGAAWLGISYLFSSGGYCFLMNFLEVFFFHTITQKSSKRYPKYFLNSLQIWPWVDFLGFFVHPVFERPYSVFAIFYWCDLLQTARKTYKNTL